MNDTSQNADRPNLKSSSIVVRQVERREWWLWGFAFIVTVFLTVAIIFLVLPGEHSERNPLYWANLREWVRGLAALVLLFDVYTMYQHLQLQRVRRQLAERDELFQLITENAADMIAVVTHEGKRVYSSPAYEKVLGYSAEDLDDATAFDKIHPSDRDRVKGAAEKAYRTGRGQKLEYRMRHKDGSWRVLESTANTIRNNGGETERLVIVNRDITDRKRAEETLAHRAIHDGLTDLPNRDLFLDRLQHAMLRARRHLDYKFAVLFVDIDEFKVVNDSLGHSAGDELLVEIAKRMSASFRDTDTIARLQTAGEAELHLEALSVARLGGDEFTVLLEDVSRASDAIRVGQRIQERLAIPFEIKGRQIVINASIGVALNASSYGKPEELVRDAEIAMYRAKQSGKARCEVFDAGMHSNAVRRLKLETDLRIGLERGELLVYYQPIVSLRSGRITGFEALSRWKHPDGMISPADFIPVADETGLILPLNRALLREACEQTCAWQLQLGCDPPLTISMNITQKQFAQPQLADEIGAILRQTGISLGNVSLEIVETIAMGDPDRALSVLSELKELGVRLSIDDFGTGYSSLSRLPRFPIDSLKIDRTFVSNMNTDRDNHEIARLIVMLAHSLGLTIVAEGAETAEQVEALTRMNCDMVQGYFYSPPVDAKAAFDLLLRGQEATAGAQ
ncbi:MAG: EAL domain-containing protein [Candidatus Sulfotelmatobacter sp.]